MFIRKRGHLYPVGWKNNSVGQLAVGQLDSWQLAVGSWTVGGWTVGSWTVGSWRLDSWRLDGSGDQQTSYIRKLAGRFPLSRE